MNLFRKLYYLLDNSDRKQAYNILVLIIFMAIMDMLGVASIMPFMSVLANPDWVETNQYLIYLFKIANLFNITSSESFIFFLGLLVFILLVSSLSLKALVYFFQLRFSMMREFSIGKRLIEGYLHQPYSWFLNSHSSDLSKNILSEIRIVVDSGIMQAAVLISQTTVTLTLLALLIYVDPVLAISVGIFFLISYFIIFKISKSYVLKIGKERMKANKDRFNNVNEAFGAFKEIKMYNLENSYINRFSTSAKNFAKHQASVSIIGQLPRFVLEGIAFGGMIILVLVLIKFNKNFTNILPIIALYAFAGYRLMPAIQQIYNAVTQLRFVSPSLHIIYKELDNLKKTSMNTYKKSDEELNFLNTIELNNINFAYPNAPSLALKNINMKIKCNEKVGIVGLTGSGKTTLIDVILGLLYSQEGKLKVDGTIINKTNRGQWQKKIGYVPQQIFLIDDTIIKNIAFGSTDENIDQENVERVAKIANLHNFILNDLPNGYQTKIGELGVRLSGGQKQRIGIARALYHNPKLMIMDEATSALDNLTEQEVIDAMNIINKDITTITIAHRLSTVKQCDNIFLLEKGEIKSSGNYNKLFETSEQFKAMSSI